MGEVNRIASLPGWRIKQITDESGSLEYHARLRPCFESCYAPTELVVIDAAFTLGLRCTLHAGLAYDAPLGLNAFVHVKFAVSIRKNVRQQPNQNNLIDVPQRFINCH